MEQYELLAPAGSLDICNAVLAAGADAVYLAGDSFGARAYAKNLTKDEIITAIRTAHLYGRKIYLAVNTLLKNREIKEQLYDFIFPLYEAGLDGVIVQDFGVIDFIKNNFPGLAIHASTQMSVAGAGGALWLKEKGISRIVAARELSLEEISLIHKKADIEIECFIHGALCYCYSGHCLMSSVLGGRSGNRGRCAQPCRLNYTVTSESGKIFGKNENYPLSLKDLCTVLILPGLMKAGIFSFKIEGRMKQLEYAAGVTAIYRKYIDMAREDPENYFVKEDDLKSLNMLGNRNGFTEGYYKQRSGKNMLSLTKSAHLSGKATSAKTDYTLPKIPVDIYAVFKEGSPAMLTVKACGVKASARGDTVQAAVSNPTGTAAIEKQLRKTGGTPFCAAELKIDSGKNIFIPVSSINELRRNALNKLSEEIISDNLRHNEKRVFKESSRRNGSDSITARENQSSRKGTNSVASHDMTSSKLIYSETKIKNSEKNKLTVRVTSSGALDEVLKYNYVKKIDIDFWDEIENAKDKIKKSGRSAGICLPYILRQTSAQRLSELKDSILGFDRIIARNYDELGLLRQWNVPESRITLSHSLYIYSETAYNAFKKCGYRAYHASAELNKTEFTHMPCADAGILLYGYLPLMISAQCVYKNFDSCIKNGSVKEKLFLSDRYNKSFPVFASCEDCFNIIYNTVPVYLMHRHEDIVKIGFGEHIISFTTEKRADIRKILEAYNSAFIKEAGITPPLKKDGYTNGHFLRGIQ